jgi:hypothetical protein
MSETILRKQPEICTACGCTDFKYLRTCELNTVCEEVTCLSCGKNWYNEYDYMRTVIYE